MAVQISDCCIETAKQVAAEHEPHPLDAMSESVSNTGVCFCGHGVKVTIYQDKDTMEDS